MENKKYPGYKNVYKRSLAMELVRCGHDIIKTMPNRANLKYQIFVFGDSQQLRKDLAELNNQEFTEEEIAE
ncbi:hypothetical protein CN692_14200 [Bacillus sp. AFS002410]|uniref:hypothetical protein n=1 Tax=Bacillus sp. AFS002410 TaxID=2033481 RepID=UPI000BF0552E|nr:hypothetical protein [Bacillus sp. AFS002410]PEJ57046.1 hypothetical protein CN692_14200 [Bacillus sp. AFS002410]